MPEVYLNAQICVFGEAGLVRSIVVIRPILQIRCFYLFLRMAGCTGPPDIAMSSDVPIIRFDIHGVLPLSDAPAIRLVGLGSAGSRPVRPRKRRLQGCPDLNLPR